MRIIVIAVVLAVVVCVLAGVAWVFSWGTQWRTVVPDSYQTQSDQTQLVLSVVADQEPAPVEAVVVSQGQDSVVVEVRTRDNWTNGVALGYARTGSVELTAPLDRRKVLDVSGQEIPEKH
ncbi:MAG: hypothetical protein LBU38_01360 [Propionibacteriaceae bacterium]|nr:hypothetical protein [Propionibacteriaceae bacterium]